ncbi:response regulator [Thermodesulfobacteriota bacterium]
MNKKEQPETPMNTKILVVDDEKRIRDVCSEMLTNEGFDVAVADSGDVGLEMIDREHFDIILLDLMMPGLSGIDLLSHVKGRHRDTLIIVITGYATLEHAIEAMKKGAFDFIAKPFSPEDLRMVVAKAIDYIRTLQDIANERSRMGALINHLAGGVLATDNQKKVALANPAFLKMVGYRGKGVIGQPLEAVVQNEKLLHMIDQALSMPEGDFSEVTEEFNHGTIGADEDAVLGVRCVPFRDRLGRNVGTVTVVHDITALKKMDQMKSDFVSMVAHEVQSPLNSILAQLKVMTDGLAGDVTEKQKDMLGRVSGKVEMLSSLARELLDLAKMESGLIMQEKEKLDLAEILESQVTLYQAKAESQGIRLVLEPLSDLKPVLGNRVNVEEVISNLISNALKYTEDGGEVIVSAASENHHVCITVRDNGLGIPKKDLDHIFNRFFRVKNDKTRFINGTGLGLAIVKSIVDAHNGIIHVESEPDQGTTFQVLLPRIED